MPANKIISIFRDIDDFCKELNKYSENGVLEDKSKKSERAPKLAPSQSEAVSIIRLLQISKFRKI